MTQLPTMTVALPVPPPQPTPPAQIFTLPYPVSYEFQVVEHVDDNDKVLRVALQVKQNQHDQWGNIFVHGTWNDVPRVKIKL